MSRDETPDTTGLLTCKACGANHYGWHACADLAAHPTPDASPDPAVVTPDAGDVPVLDELAALELAEEVWEDEPTDAEQELMQRVLASDWLANHVAAAREADRAEVERLRAEVLDAWEDDAEKAALVGTLAIQREAAEERLAGLVAKIEALAHSPETDKYRDEACRGVVALPYASNRYVRLLDDLRALIPADAATGVTS